MTMRKHMHMTSHIVNDKLICAAQSHATIDQEHPTEMCVVDDERLVSGSFDPTSDAVRLEGDPDTRCNALLI